MMNGVACSEIQLRTASRSGFIAWLSNGTGIEDQFPFPAPQHGMMGVSHKYDIFWALIKPLPVREIGINAPLKGVPGRSMKHGDPDRGQVQAALSRPGQKQRLRPLRERPLSPFESGPITGLVLSFRGLLQSNAPREDLIVISADADDAILVPHVHALVYEGVIPHQVAQE